MNTQNKHTLGPWQISEYPNGFNLEVIAPDGIIASVRGTSGTKEETQANAHLIAAAPDLLAACELALGFWKTATSSAWADVENKLSAALSKARGD